MPIEFECGECRKRLRVRDDMAGKRAKCPGCDAVVTVPSADEPRPHTFRASDDNYEPPRRPLPSLRKKPSSWPAVLGLSLAGVALLLLVGGGLLLWHAVAPAPPGPPMTAFVPGDGQVFLAVRPADLARRQPGLREQIAQAAAQQPGAVDPVAMLEGNLGLRLDEVERFTLVVEDARRDVLWMVLETTRPADRGALRGRLLNPDDSTHLGKPYTVGGFPGVLGRVAVHHSGPRVLVIGPEEGVLRAIETAENRAPGPLDEGVALLDARKPVVGAFNLPPDVNAQLKEGLKGNLFAGALLPLTEVRSGTVTASLGDRADLEASLRFPGEAEAKAAKSALALAVPGVRAMIGLARFGNPKEQQEALDQFSKSLSDLKVEQRGDRLVLTLPVKNPEPKR